MNPLYLRRKAFKLGLLGVGLFLCGFSSLLFNEISEEFLIEIRNSDAYYLNSDVDVSYSSSGWRSYKRDVYISNKLVVNNATGVDDYAFLNMSSSISNNLQEIKVRTLKADGSVVELDSSVVFKRKKGERLGDINYPISSVEPGDTIETSFMYREYINKGELMDYVSLNLDIPSLSSRYSVYSTPYLLVRYKPYNEFPEPEVISNDTIIYLEFNMKEVKGLKENEYTCLSCELPYLYYSLEKRNSEIRTWRDVYNEEFNFITQPMALDYEKTSYYKRWKRRVIGEAKDSSKYHKFKLLYQEVIKNFEMKAAMEEELIKSSGYFLKEGKFDPISIRRFYRQLLEDLEIDYWAVFARSKRSGKIDTHYIRKGEYDHVFFAFENERGSINFLYPHNELFMYQIDEIPTTLYNTTAIVVKPHVDKKMKKKDKFISRDLKMAKVDSVAMAEITLPGMNASHNYIKQMIYSDVDINNERVGFKYRFMASGGLSTELRGFFSMMNQNEEVSDFYDAMWEFEGEDALEIDSITNFKFGEKRPFTYTMNATGKINNAIRFINDSLVSVSINDLIQHNQIVSDDESTELNYYLDFNYSDYYMLLLNFPCDIEVLGLENNDVNFKNEFGEYFFEMKQSNSHQLKLQSNYKILKDMIPKEKYEMIKSLNNQVKSIKGRRILIKLKEHEV